VSEGTKWNLPAGNTLVQLLALYTDPESHNVQRYKQRDGRTDGQTDDRIAHTSCPCATLLGVAVRGILCRSANSCMATAITNNHTKKKHAQQTHLSSRCFSTSSLFVWLCMSQGLEQGATNSW